MATKRIAGKPAAKRRSPAPSTRPPAARPAGRRASDVPEELEGFRDLPSITRAVLPIGTIVASALREGAFAALVDGAWVLADGRAVDDRTAWAWIVRHAPAGVYDRSLLRGDKVHVPNLCGRFLRGKNNDAAGADSGNPAGDLPIGSFQKDALRFHTHEFNRSYAPGAERLYAYAIQHGARNTGLERGETNHMRVEGQGPGGLIGSPTDERANETRARNVTINYFIRIA